MTGNESFTEWQQSLLSGPNFCLVFNACRLGAQGSTLQELCGNKMKPFQSFKLSAADNFIGPAVMVPPPRVCNVFVQMHRWAEREVRAVVLWPSKPARLAGQMQAIYLSIYLHLFDEGLRNASSF